MKFIELNLHERLQKAIDELGFIETSYEEEDIVFTQFTLTTEKFVIDISGLDLVEIKFVAIGWLDVPNCKTIEDLKQLIRLFKNE